MDSSAVFSALWRLRLWIALGAVVALVASVPAAYHVSTSPLKLERKSSSFGAARAMMYTDYGLSAVGYSTDETAPLDSSAQIVARLTDSGDIRRSIAEGLGFGPDANAVSIQGPFPNSSLATSTAPSAQQRANSIVPSGRGYNVYITTEPNIPTIGIFTSAPTGALAIKLANVTVDALGSMLAQARKAGKPVIERSVRTGVLVTQREEKRILSKAEVDERMRRALQGGIVLRKTGSASGGDVTVQTHTLAMVGEFAAVFGAWCVVLLTLSLTLQRRRRRPEKVFATSASS